MMYTPAKPNPKQEAMKRLLYGRTITGPSVPISEVTEDAGRITVVGEVLSYEERAIKNDTALLMTFAVTDYTGTLPCKIFAATRGGDDERAMHEIKALAAALKEGPYVRLRGRYQQDHFTHEMTVMVDDIMREDKPTRKDTAERKRVELHMHTQMSTMDGLCLGQRPDQAGGQVGAPGQWPSPTTACCRPSPRPSARPRRTDIKLIPGCEGYLIDDAAQVVDLPDERALADDALRGAGRGDHRPQRGHRHDH